MITANMPLPIPIGMEDTSVRILDAPTTQDWLLVRNLLLGTVGKCSNTETITADTKRKIIASEHSPLRTLQITWEWVNLPSWVSVHLVRHHVGCTPYVQTQRNDRQNNYDRTKAPQDTPVLHRETANAQSILDISKRRLCKMSAEQTRYAWMLFLVALAKYEPELTHACVPQCVYRNGLCPELFKNCGEGVDTKWLNQYRMLFVKTK